MLAVLGHRADRAPSRHGVAACESGRVDMATRTSRGGGVHLSPSMPVPDPGSACPGGPSSAAPGRGRSSRRSDSSRATPAGPAPPRGDEVVERALRLVVGAAARALLGSGGEVGEVVHDPVRVDVGQPERPDAGGVDHPAALRQPQRDRRGRRVPAAAGDLVDHPGGPVGARDQGVDQRRLADAGVPDQHGDPPAPAGRGRRPDPRRSPSATRRVTSVGDVERGVAAEELVRRRRRSALVSTSSGSQPGVVGGDQAAVDHARPRGSGSASAVTTASWSALATTARSIGSVSSALRRSSELRSARPGRSGPGVPALPADVADQRDPVADDDAGAAELAGLHRRDHPVGVGIAAGEAAEQAGVAAAVDRRAPGR